MKIQLILLLVLCNIINFNDVLAEENYITVYPNREIGQVNNKVFGNNFLGFDNKKHNHSVYGTGLWNPAANELVDEVMDLAKSSGIAIVRFATLNDYDWKKAIGKKREGFSYGIDEFLKSMEILKAEPVFIIPYFTGTEQDATDLIDYLNAHSDGKHPWADKRDLNGHPAAYNAKYFEFGNEVFVFWSEKHNYKVTPEEYAEKYLLYRGKMKSADNSVQLGLNIHHYDREWDRRVLEKVGSNVDYFVRHVYPPKDLSYYNSTEHYEIKDMFMVMLGSLNEYTDKQFSDYIRFAKNITGKSETYFAISEYNVGLPQQTPPYRHMLGAALVNAELIKIFMKPENKVLMANYWHFANDHWGSIKAENNFMSHDYEKPIKYIRRPNFYVYEMYNKHFGDILIDGSVLSKTYALGEYKKYVKALKRLMKNTMQEIEDENMIIPYLSVNASKSKDGKKVYLMVINKHMDETMTSLINLKDVSLSKKGDVWILNGPAIDATNEEVADNVKVTHKEFEVKNNQFKINFEPHSLTAIEVTVNAAN